MTDEAMLNFIREADRKFREIDRRLQEMDCQLRALSKEIAGRGDWLDGLTEDTVDSTMREILIGQFGMENIAPSCHIMRDGLDIEEGFMAWANDPVNQAILVERESQPNEESLQKLLGRLERFHELLPMHANKKAVGILAGEDWNPDIKQRTLEAGIYVASTKDDLFTMQTPEGFEPRKW